MSSDLRTFKGVAQILEKKGYTQFMPHYITWYCPEVFTLSKSQCINHGRYCAPDPEQDFSKGYDGRDVVIQNLRQICLLLGIPLAVVINALGVDLKRVSSCVGDPEADQDNSVLKAVWASLYISSPMLTIFLVFIT